VIRRADRQRRGLGEERRIHVGPAGDLVSSAGYIIQMTLSAANVERSCPRTGSGGAGGRGGPGGERQGQQRPGRGLSSEENGPWHLSSEETVRCPSRVLGDVARIEGEDAGATVACPSAGRHLGVTWASQGDFLVCAAFRGVEIRGPTAEAQAGRLCRLPLRLRIHRKLCGIPRGETTGHLDQIREPLSMQDAGGDRRAVAARTMDGDTALAGDFAEALLQVIERDVHRCRRYAWSPTRAEI